MSAVGSRSVSTQRALLVAGAAVLALSAVALFGGIVSPLAPGERTGHLGSWPWVVVTLCALAGSLPSLRLLLRAPLHRRALQASGELPRARRIAELGAAAWAVLAANWLFGYPSTGAWQPSLWLTLAAFVVCVAVSVVLFRIWARLRG